MKQKQATSNRPKYELLSPDNIPINWRGGYNTKAEALADFERWRQGYERQGYYSTFVNGERHRIPLTELFNHCKLIKI